MGRVALVTGGGGGTGGAIATALADPAVRAPWVARIPLRRVATTDDLVPVVLLPAADQAAHITGTVLPVDGGQLLGS